MAGDARHGLNRPAGLESVPHSRFHHGRFGRLFPNLDPATHTEGTLRALAAGMNDPREPAPKAGGWGGGKGNKADGDNAKIPAGYTYFGQFVDHDITFDPASELLRANDPNALHNFRTPRFDLDNVYGEGPADEPFLYDQETGPEKWKMLIGAIAPLEGESESPGRDLPRNSQGRALIGDPRNDENAVVAQLQLAFLLAHNKLVDELESFQEARRQLRWHYQYVVVNDFLRRILPKEILDEIPAKGAPVDWCELCHCRFGHELPFMPVEFSVAAYRFGHSMVRPAYDLGAEALDKAIFDDESPAEDLTDLRGFRPLPPEYRIEWHRFLKLKTSNPQPSRLIDTKLAAGLADLPGEEERFQSLAVRNLLRGEALELPWGEAVAKALGKQVLTPAQVLDGVDLTKDQRKELESRTPLWFYILREAEVLGGGGQTLGPVGGWIVAKTLLCLLAGDRFSYVNIEPKWTPKEQGLVKQEKKGKYDFELADLIRFATT